MRPVPQADIGLIAGLRADLSGLGYTVAGVETLLGPVATAALDREHATPARMRIAELLSGTTTPQEGAREGTEEFLQTGLAAVISVWMLGDPVPVQLIDDALPHTGSHGAAELNLGWTSEGRFYPAVDMSPYATDISGDLWVASDQTALQTRAPLPEEHVLGVGRASLTLAGIAPRPQVHRALDLGTGCGIQTLHLLTHAQHVTATDISERALAFTRFNLLINAPALELDADRLEERVRLVAGNMLEPVAGEQFDLVITNPPFVITPARAQQGHSIHTYRETGATGDAVVAELFAQLGTVLAPAGMAVLLGNWEIHDDAAWDQRPRGWIGSAEVPVHAWVVQREVQDPAEYAETWLQDSSDTLNPDAYQQRYADYLEDFRARGVSGIGFGYVTLRRPPVAEQPVRVRAEELTGPLQQPLGPVWEQAWQRWEELADPTQILHHHITVPFHVTEVRHQHFGAVHPEIIMAVQGAGFRRSTGVDTAVAAVLSAADGELRAGQLISAVAGLLELTAEQEHELTEQIAGLAVDGFVETGQSAQ